MLAMERTADQGFEEKKESDYQLHRQSEPYSVQPMCHPGTVFNEKKPNELFRTLVRLSYD